MGELLGGIFCAGDKIADEPVDQSFLFCCLPNKISARVSAGYLIFFPLDQRFAPGARNFWVGAAHPGGLIFLDKIVGCGFCIRWIDFFFVLLPGE